MLQKTSTSKESTKKKNGSYRSRKSGSEKSYQSREGSIIEMWGDEASLTSQNQLPMIPIVDAGTPKNLEQPFSTDTDFNRILFGETEQTTQQSIEKSKEIEGQDLILEPKNLRWNSEGGYQTVQLQNTTDSRLAVKAKCSDNELYRVNPVFGFINPRQKLKVDIVRQKAVPKVDKLIFVTVPANNEDLLPKPLFKQYEDNQKMTVLPLLVARAI